jgi:hypothetical protein
VPTTSACRCTAAGSRSTAPRSTCTGSASRASSPRSARRERSLPPPCSTTPTAQVTGATRGDLGRSKGAGVAFAAPWVPEVEALLGGLRTARAADHLASAVSVGTAPGESQRWLVLIELCDVLDKWDDGRIAYGSDDRDDRRFVDRHESQLIELAARSGWPEVAAGLEVAFRRLAEDELPEGLLLGWRHSEVVAPPSFRRRLTIRVRGRARHALRRWRARPAPSPPTPGGR